MSQSELQKVVLITGCSEGGIGFALCEAFAEQGCLVYATARKLSAMDALTSPRIRKLVLDVTSDADVERVVSTILKDVGRVDVLVNNAGAICMGALADIPIESFLQSFDTNVASALRLAKAVIPSMAQRKKGLIINLGSTVGEVPTPWNGTYSITKAATLSLSEVLFMECQPLNINVMHISPGGVRSNIVVNHRSHFSVPEGSLYGAYVGRMVERMELSQLKHERGMMAALGRLGLISETGPMDTRLFARKVVAKALMNNPPWYLTLGKGTFFFTLIQWLPRKWMMAIVWRMMGKI